VAPFEFLAANNIPAKDSVKQNTFYAVDWIFTSGRSAFRQTTEFFYFLFCLKATTLYVPR
jgi:hypothetical protein